MRRARRRRTHVRCGRHMLYPALAALCAAMICAGGILTYKRAAESKRIREKNDLLAQFYLQEKKETPAAIPSAAPSHSPPISSASAPPESAAAARTPVTVNGTFTSEIKERFSELLKQNTDTVGWLSIEGVLSYPVVQKDNDYYLTHDFYRSVSGEGAIFLDEHYELSPPNENLLLHGHNMKDGSMFGRLAQYKTYSYVKSHPIIQFDSLYEDASYVIYAVISAATKGTQAKDFYSHRSFASDASFGEYASLVSQSALFRPRVDISPGDRLLTLSTCDGSNTDQRIVIIARMLRENETEAALRSQF